MQQQQPPLSMPYIPASVQRQQQLQDQSRRRARSKGGNGVSMLDQLRIEELSTSETFSYDDAKTQFGQMWRRMILYYTWIVRPNSEYARALAELRDSRCSPSAIASDGLMVWSWEDVQFLESYARNACTLFENTTAPYFDKKTQDMVHSLFRFVRQGLSFVRLRDEIYGGMTRTAHKTVNVTLPNVRDTSFVFPVCPHGEVIADMFPDYYHSCRKLGAILARILNHVHCCLSINADESALLSRFVESIADLQRIRGGVHDVINEPVQVSCVRSLVLLASITSIVIGRSRKIMRPFLFAKSMVRELAAQSNKALRNADTPKEAVTDIQSAYSTCVSRYGMTYTSMFSNVASIYEWLIGTRVGHERSLAIANELRRPTLFHPTRLFYDEVVACVKHLAEWRNKFANSTATANVCFEQHLPRSAACFDDLRLIMYRHKHSIVHDALCSGAELSSESYSISSSSSSSSSSMNTRIMPATPATAERAALPQEAPRLVPDRSRAVDPRVLQHRTAPTRKRVTPPASPSLSSSDEPQLTTSRRRSLHVQQVVISDLSDDSDEEGLCASTDDDDDDDDDEPEEKGEYNEIESTSDDPLYRPTATSVHRSKRQRVSTTAPAAREREEKKSPVITAQEAEDIVPTADVHVEDMSKYEKLVDYAMRFAESFVKRAVRRRDRFDSYLPHEKVSKDALPGVKKCIVDGLRKYYDAKNKKTFIGVEDFGSDRSPIVSLKLNMDGLPARRNCVYVRKDAHSALQRALKNDSKDPTRRIYLVDKVWSAMHAACRQNVVDEKVILDKKQSVYADSCESDDDKDDEKDEGAVLSDSDIFENDVPVAAELSASEETSSIPFSHDIASMVKEANVDPWSDDTRSHSSSSSSEVEQARVNIVPVPSVELCTPRIEKRKNSNCRYAAPVTSSTYETQRLKLANGDELSKHAAFAIRDETIDLVGKRVRRAVLLERNMSQLNDDLMRYCFGEVFTPRLKSEQRSETRAECMLTFSEERALKEAAYQHSKTLLIRSGVYMSVSPSIHIPLMAVLSNDGGDGDDDPLKAIKSASYKVVGVMWWFDPEARNYESGHSDMRAMLASASQDQLAQWVSRMHVSTPGGIVRPAPARTFKPYSMIKACEALGCDALSTLACYGVFEKASTRRSHSSWRSVCERHIYECGKSECGAHVCAYCLRSTRPSLSTFGTLKSGRICLAHI